MKHHIENEELKRFKKYLWNLRSKDIIVEFYVDSQLDDSSEFLLINYGLVQTDKNGNVISSNDSSYQSYYRRLASKDNVKYYQVLFDTRGQPQRKFYITDKSLEFKIENDKLVLSWISLSNEKKELKIRYKDSSLVLTDEAINSRYFSLSRSMPKKEKVNIIPKNIDSYKDQNIEIEEYKRKLKEEKKRKRLAEKNINKENK